MNRRWVWASSAVNTSSSVRVFMSSHGEISLIGTPSTGRSSSSEPTICWVHVVPHFDGVEMTTSSGRNSNRSHRELSLIVPSYRRSIRRA